MTERPDHPGQPGRPQRPEPPERLSPAASPTLRTRRLLLRDARTSDADALWTVQAYDGRMAADAAEARAIVERIRADQAAGETLHWVICRRGDGVPIGTVGFYRGFAGGRGEIGYVLLADARGRGLAREAADAVCRHGLGPLGLEAIVAWTEPANTPSRALLVRLGFREEGPDDGRIRYLLDELPAQDSSGSGGSPS